MSFSRLIGFMVRTTVNTQCLLLFSAVTTRCKAVLGGRVV